MTLSATKEACHESTSNSANCKIVSIVFLSCAACSSKKEKPKTKPTIPVKTTQAQQKDVPILVKAIGNIEAFTRNMPTPPSFRKVNPDDQPVS